MKMKGWPFEPSNNPGAEPLGGDEPGNGPPEMDIQNSNDTIPRLFRSYL